MEKCDSCGLEKEVCKVCGTEIYKQFIYFIDKTEMIYAILMAVGFAKSAEQILRPNHIKLIPLLIINAFVLMRFFFAPSRNLKKAALIVENTPKIQWRIFLWDFPVLIFHSFAYFAMCYAFRLGAESTIRFYQWFMILLLSNAIWLYTIVLRMRKSPKEKKEDRQTFSKWIFNNSIHLIILGLLWLLFWWFKGLMDINIDGWFYGLLFLVAFSNCCFDFILTAPSYLGFRKITSYP